MKKPASIVSLDELGRTRLSKSFFMREFLYSEVANFHGIPNIPDNPDLAVKVGTRLCEELLEPLQAVFGKVVIRSAYRSKAVNGFCNEQQLAKKSGYTCASNEKNYAGHIWDEPDANGLTGATACIVIPWFADRYEKREDWRAIAWWVHDHLPYSDMQFFPKLAAFNISWHEKPRREIYSYIEPKGWLTKQGEPNHLGTHAEWYPGFPALVKNLSVGL